MFPAPCFVLGDAHVGAAPPDAEETLLALLDRARTEAGSVVLNGDVFDFHFEWRHSVTRPSVRVLGALARLRDAGVPVLYMAGNHDCWGGDLLSRDTGVTYSLDAWRGDLAGWKTLIEHGDGLRGRGDAPYRLLRAFVRNPIVTTCFSLLPPDLAVWLATRSSGTSRHKRPRDGGVALYAVAQRRLATDPTLDLYVFGHSHTRAVEATPTGGVLANPGAWLDEPSFLVITPDALELRRMTAGGADEVLTRIAKRDVSGR
jgi:UDP-2,3-diacylglucosamine hydrolase